MLHQVGAGVLGPVFRAHDGGTEVAVKVFRIDLTPEQAMELAGALQDLARRFPLHPSVVRCVAAGVSGSTAWVAEEYVGADALDTRLRRRLGGGLEHVLPVLRQIGEAIDAAAAAGIHHGALHPRDVLLSTAGDVRVTGFGIATALQGVGAPPVLRRPYSAPERALVPSTAPDVKADVFSLGAIAVELLTLRRPMGVGAAATNLVSGVADGVDADRCRAALARAMAESPLERFPTAGAFVRSLTRAVHGASLESNSARRGAEPGRLALAAADDTTVPPDAPRLEVIAADPVAPDSEAIPPGDTFAGAPVSSAAVMPPETPVTSHAFGAGTPEQRADEAPAARDEMGGPFEAATADAPVTLERQAGAPEHQEVAAWPDAPAESAASEGLEPEVAAPAGFGEAVPSRDDEASWLDGEARSAPDAGFEPEAPHVGVAPDALHFESSAEAVDAEVAPADETVAVRDGKAWQVAGDEPTLRRHADPPGPDDDLAVAAGPPPSRAYELNLRAWDDRDAPLEAEGAAWSASLPDERETPERFAFPEAGHAAWNPRIAAGDEPTDGRDDGDRDGDALPVDDAYAPPHGDPVMPERRPVVDDAGEPDDDPDAVSERPSFGSARGAPVPFARRVADAPEYDSDGVPASGGWSSWWSALLLVAGVAVGLGAGYVLWGRSPDAVAQSAVLTTEEAVDGATDLQGGAPDARGPGGAATPTASGSTPDGADVGRTASAAGRPRHGELVVRSEPGGAQVTVNGRARGRTPLTLDDLGFGAYDVRVTRDGFRGERRRVRLTADDPRADVALTLRRAPGASRTAARPRATEGAAASKPATLDVVSRPAGARVFIDGRLVGTTPYRATGVRAGRRSVRLELDGYGPWGTTIDVEPGAGARVAASLELTSSQ